MSHDIFSKRMKRYEKSFTDIKLLPRCPVIIRLDGKSFHTYTKQFKDKDAPDPFSEILHNAFVHASIKLAGRTSGCRAVYTQSDEVTVWLDDKGKSKNSQGWFDFELQKIVSVSASILTGYFNEMMNTQGYTELAFFDSRAFNLPNMIELNNNFLWRQVDATRNSISMMAQHYFSHKELQGLDSNQLQDKLFKDKGINWNDLPEWKKRGTLIIKKKYIKDIKWIDKKGTCRLAEGVERGKWEQIDCPQFSQVPIFEIVK